MALAYAVVLVAEDLYRGDQRSAVQAAQAQADKRFEALAQEARKTLVTRNPEPRVMTHPEMRNAFPAMGEQLNQLVGLYFTADIS